MVFMERTTLYADILLPLPLKGTFTYRVPYTLNDSIQQGQRAVVQFGARRVYAGLVRRVHSNPPGGVHAKYILSLLDEVPVVRPEQFRFWEWLASYYMCTEGEVMNAALPPAMKLAGETRIVLNPDFHMEEAPDVLNEKEYVVVKALANKKTLTMGEVSAIAGLPKVLPLVKTLIEKGVVLLQEDLENPWRPRMLSFVKLSEAYEPEDSLKELFDQLERKAPRQLEVLVNFIRQSGRYEPSPREVEQATLVRPVKGGAAALLGMIKKGVFEVYRKKVSRLDHVEAVEEQITFNEHQQKAWDEMQHAFSEKNIVLLHGVTSSGKTELYIKLIREYLDRGQQVLYLLPEIALTAQIITRLQKHFGKRAGIYHSRFNPMERVEVWNNLLLGGIESSGEKIAYDLVLGPRSAMFLPFSNLGLVIIDEEHEPSFKQHDPAPRYNARDAAIYLASTAGAKVLLGSATPSVESYFNAQSGKYGLVTLDKRHGGVMMPEVLVADVKQETRRKQMKSHFSPLLYEGIQDALEQQQQVILFQNRRGFSLRIECELCNWIPECTQCDVSLVYHKKINKLRCHYCGYTKSPPAQCPSCAGTALKMKGFGTEKIEEELPLYFPQARLARMDLDTTRAKNAYSQIISDFENHQIDILIGTQMVSKGLDFSNVSVVGILNADNMLNFPDFRAHERAYQLMAQVSGRAGRDKKRGRVIIQSYNPLHNVIRQVIDNNYNEMYREQILERRNFHYPPFNRLLLITTLHRDENTLNQAAETLATCLRRAFPKKVFGPEYPIITRIRNLFQKTILVKLDKGATLPRDKEKIEKLVEAFSKKKEFRQVRVILNVDPV
jgi:primosomal protein N' (replication factor Y) (superfamily II helicase)